MDHGLFVLVEIVHGVDLPSKYGPWIYFTSNFIPSGPISYQDLFYCYTYL